MSIELKRIGGRIVEIKEEQRNDQPVGIISGYIATWDIDRGGYMYKDQFIRGAFIDSIREHQLKKRQIRLKDQHGSVIGGFPIESVHEDDTGLFGVGEINLDVKRGQEIMALARQGVLEDFSIGFSAIEHVIEVVEDVEIRKITKAIIWEGSVVDEPMNPAAKITDVKSLIDLPIASIHTPWDADMAALRVVGYSGLPIVDMIGGKLNIIPNAVIDYCKSPDLPPNDVKSLEKILAEMNMASPFETDVKEYYTAADVESITSRNLEKVLRASGAFSRSAVKMLVRRLLISNDSSSASSLDIIDELKAIGCELDKS